jgi:rubrerythrin
MSFSDAQANVFILPQRKPPFPGMVLGWIWLCRKCGYWWKPKDYEKPPETCPSCNLENWLEAKEGQNPASPMNVPKAVRRH